MFHALRHEDPEVPESPVLECAVKIFKTTLTEFKNRAKFLMSVHTTPKK